MHVSLRLATAGAAAVAAVTLAGVAFAQTTPVPAPLGKPMSFAFAAQNGSDETGTLTLQAKGNDTIVTIALKNAAGPQPAHIHEGTCAALNPKPAFPLSNVVDGKSTTTVPVPLGKLFGSQKYAVNVHKSPTDIATYVACADIAPRNGMPVTSTGTAAPSK